MKELCRLLLDKPTDIVAVFRWGGWFGGRIIAGLVARQKVENERRNLRLSPTLLRRLCLASSHLKQGERGRGRGERESGGRWQWEQT